MSARPFWLSAFLDFAPGDFERGVAFWSAVTGYAVSARRGPETEFATLLPPDGDDFLRVQRLGAGPGRIHLDLHVSDPAAAADEALTLGATVVDRAAEDFVVLASPGAFTFCFVQHPGDRVPSPAAWPGVARSRVYQVCLDVPADRYDARERLLGRPGRRLDRGAASAARSSPGCGAAGSTPSTSCSSGWTARPARSPRTSTSAPPTARPRWRGTSPSARPPGPSRSSGRC